MPATTKIFLTNLCRTWHSFVNINTCTCTYIDYSYNPISISEQTLTLCNMMAMNTIIVKWVWANTVAAPKAMPSAEEDKNSH